MADRIHPLLTPRRLDAALPKDTDVVAWLRSQKDLRLSPQELKVADSQYFSLDAGGANDDQYLLLRQIVESTRGEYKSFAVVIHRQGGRATPHLLATSDASAAAFEFKDVDGDGIPDLIVRSALNASGINDTYYSLRPLLSIQK